MQDDSKVTPSTSDQPPIVPQSSQPMPENNVPVPQPSAPDAPPVSPQVPPAATPTLPMSDELAKLLSPEQDHISPATSTGFNPGQVSGPGYGGPFMGGPTGSMPPAPANSPKHKFLLPGAIVAALVLMLAAAYYLSIYLPNTPSHVYSESLSNSGLALDMLVQYSQKQEHANYSTTSFTGTLHGKSPGASYDMTMTGAIDKNANANIQLNSDIMGEKVNANILSIKAAGNTAPDIYVRVTGIKSMLDSLGMNSLDKVDGEWISIDHTLVESYLSSVASKSQSNTSTGAPTYAAVEDAISKVQAVNKRYLFSTNATTAVFSNPKFIAKETSGGHTLDHYKVGYSKAHLNAYLTAVGQALNSSQLNSWYKGVSSGKNLSDGMDISSWQKQVNSAPANYTFDMWSDTKTKLISKISFTDPSNKSSVFSIAQNYTGGSTYPFQLGFTGKDSSGNPEAASLNVSVDTNTNKMTFALTDNTTSSDGITNVTANISATPSNTPVAVTAPKNSESVTNLLLQLGLGSGSASTPLLSQSAVRSLTAKK